MSINLPTSGDGVDGLLGLPELLGVPADQVYKFLGFVRDNAGGSAVVLQTRQVLAARMVKAYQAGHPCTFTEARIAVYDQLGKPVNQRPHFNALITKGNQMSQSAPGWADHKRSHRTLPTADEGVDGLLSLLPTYGLTETQLFRFLGWLRESDGAKLVGEARKILAARMVVKRMRLHETEDLETAQRETAKTLAYPTHHRPNFYKRVRDGMTLLDTRGEL